MVSCSHYNALVQCIGAHHCQSLRHQVVVDDTCCHHVFRMQTAKLVLMSKRGVNGALPAAPLAFALRGEVDARGPLKRIKTSAQLYEFQEVEVKLTNPFQVLRLDLG